MARLTKRDAEALLERYDADPVGALTVALAKAIDAPAGATWPELLFSAALSESRRAALINGETAALDALAVELNEARQLAAMRPMTGCA